MPRPLTRIPRSSDNGKFLGQRRSGERIMITEIVCNECAMGKYDCDCGHDWTKAEVAELVKCDFCAQIADYDAKITRPAYNGMWANMCRLHWEDMTNQKLGLGLGQKLEKA